MGANLMHFIDKRNKIEMEQKALISRDFRRPLPNLR